MFKKQRLSARKKPSPIIMKTVGTIGVFLVLFLAITSLSYVSGKNFDVYKTFSNTPIFEAKKEVSSQELARKEAEKQQQLLLEQKNQNDEDKINTLIIGRGGVQNDAPELTDSIILLSFHKKKNHISMVSIPRDLYVEYGDVDKNGNVVKGKINGLYVHFLSKYQSEQQAIAKLQETITYITGEEIDHYVNIDFTGFVKLVDSLGGVDVTVPETLIDTEYPDNNHGYQTFYIKKGSWNLKGSQALKYVRSRKNTGGDFGRSQRQQQVITAIKDGVLDDGYLTSPSNIKELYSIVTENLSTDLGVIQALKLMADIKLQENTKVYSFGLNATCLKTLECDRGGYLYYPQRKFFEGLSVVLIESGELNAIDNFSTISDYFNIVFNSPSLLDEEHKISIFTKAPYEDEAKELQSHLKKLGFKIEMEEIIGNIPEPQEITNEATGPGIDEENVRINRALNLEEYNASQKNTVLGSNNADKPISQEYGNVKTKIIINGVLSTSVSISRLKEILNLEDIDIIRYPDKPKYAKDPNTQIEILYVPEKKSLGY